MGYSTLRQALIAPILPLLWACSDAPEDPAIVAMVAGAPIRQEQLRAFQEQLPPSLQRGAHADLDDLQTLIDRRLLDLEARSRGLGEDAQVLGQLRKEEEAKLFEQMMHRQVDTRLDFVEEEVVHEFEKGWAEQVETLEFFVTDEEQVAQVQGLLDNGTEFAEIGRTFSLDRVLKMSLGHAQSFTYSPFDQPKAVVGEVFKQPAGAVVRAIPLLDGFVFAKVIARRTVALEAVRSQVEQSLLRKKRHLLRSVYLIDLRKRLELTFHQEGMDLAGQVLRREVPLDSLSAAQKSALVYSYDGGVLDVQGVCDAVSRAIREWPDVREGFVVGHLKEYTLPRRLAALDARAQGMDQGDDFQAWRQATRADLMVARLRTVILEEKMRITQEDLTAHYEANIASFTNPDRARVQELLVSDRALALQLKEQIEQGGDMEALIRQHSIVEQPTDGKVRVSTPQAPYYGEQWVEAVMEAPLDQIQGPVASRQGFSVFRVYERYPAESLPLTGYVLQKVRAQVKDKKSRTVFADFLKSLREKYAAQVAVYEERLD